MAALKFVQAVLHWQPQSSPHTKNGWGRPQPFKEKS